MADVNETMFNIMEQEKFYEEVEFQGPTKLWVNQMKNLLIVSHMDDETIFFGNWLFLNGKDTKVISTCEPSTNPPKRESFQKVMDIVMSQITKCGIGKNLLMDMMTMID